MSSPETHAKKRPRPTAEGVALATAISQIHIIPFVQTALSLAIHDRFSQVPPEHMKEIALGAFAASLLISYFYEVETLKRLGLTSNPLTVLIYFKVKSPQLATLIGDVAGQVLHTFNPVDITYLIALLGNQDGGHAFYSNLIARSILGFSFVTGFNWALRQGHADRIVAKIHEGRRVLTEIIDDQLDRFGVYALDEAIFPPRPIDYPDNSSGDFHARHGLNINP